MKTRIVLLSAVSSFVAFSAFGQAIENDDMYFNKKDRVKLNAQKPVEQAYVPSKKSEEIFQNVEPVYASNASYSARNLNPEYAARSNAQEAQTDNQDYFVTNYQFNNATATNLNQYNNNLNNWYNNPMYNSAYMGSAINSWNSPYYGMNSMYNSPWYDPFYSNNGFSSSFSYYYGNAYSYGWGGNYNYWNQPYCGGSSWGSYYGSGWGSYNNYYGYGNYGYYSPNVIIINSYGESGGRGVTYGKRPTSGGGIVSGQANGSRTRSNVVATNSGSGRSYTGGRTSTSSGSTQQSAYYNRSWRDAQQAQSNYNNSSNRGWNGNTQQNSSYDFNRSNSNSRSSSFDGGGNSGSGTRSHSSTGSSSGSSGSSGRTRGRD